MDRVWGSLLVVHGKRLSRFQGDQYTLTLRKQGGLEMPFEVTVELPAEWKGHVTLGEIMQESPTTLQWKGSLTEDGVLTVQRQ